MNNCAKSDPEHCLGQEKNFTSKQRVSSAQTTALKKNIKQIQELNSLKIIAAG